MKLIWVPRILAIAFICFLALFSFDSGSPLGFLIHNIPVLILLVILSISWKHELVGGILFILAGLFLFILSRTLIITGPAIIIGILFVIKKRTK